MADRNVVRLNKAVTTDVCEALRELADTIESEGKPIRAWAVVTLHEEDFVGTAFAGEDELRLVGVLETLKQRVINGWDE